MKRMCVMLKNRLLHHEAGSITIMLAIALPVLISAIGLATDFSKLESAKARFGNAVDQAVLAAASSGAENPTAYAREYVLANVQGYGITLGNVDVQVDANRTSWSITANGEAESFFTQLFGKNSFSISHNAKAVWDNSKTTELVAMVDVSGTMCAKFVRSKENDSTVIDFVPDRACTKLAMMKEALTKIAKAGVSYNSSGGPPAYKVGIVPFTYKVKVAHPENMPSFMTKGEIDGGYSADYFTNVTDAEMQGGPLPAVVPLTPIGSQADKDALVAKIDAITDGSGEEFNRVAWKRSSLGAQVSALMLDPRYSNIFGGAAPAAFGAPNASKIVIMMTDSANIGCCFTNFPAGNFRNYYIYSYSRDHKFLVGDGGQSGVCQKMKDAGIEIYTVLLDVNPKDTNVRGQEIVDSFKTCATDSKHSFQINIDDTDTLRQAYDVIGRALIKIRLDE